MPSRHPASEPNQPLRSPPPSSVPSPDARASHLVRNNSEWISSLKGEMGYHAQQDAHQRLSAYLFTVIHEHVRQRQPAIHWLSTLDGQEVTALSQDLVQTGLEKLSRDNHALLARYGGQGAFTSWAAQVLLNIARSELRRVRWHRLQPMDDLLFVMEADAPSPQQAVEQGQLIATVDHCLAQLPAQYRTILIRCIMHGEKPSDVAQDLGRSAQSVYNLVSRAKKRMGELLERNQVGVEDLWALVG